MKPSQGKAIIEDCKRRGWVQHGDKLLTPTQALNIDLKQVKRKSRTSHIKTGWIDDTRNIANKIGKSDMFDRLVMIELGLEIWNEFYFSTDRQYRFDKAIPTMANSPQLKIAIEINGGIWAKGNSGHSSGTGIKRDMDKSNLAQSLGWRIISVEPDDITKRPSYVIDMIRSLF